ncbi:transporter substrate-binding domain-containing protein [Pseudodesulfovibrio sediminis]|uniref:Solute-binding protein family 3/N-terminal domain-containing protein n=1 Tax=Pseudodesulfovibrio sediminis TaxID=2810563 RepID=A0ABN6ERV7_9BACT|nr:transporter substrate-binding domain-containing protein [Pseudodesulfovibrio sediminis]BCS88192.1 hypothetical protein PSDVSF_14340 [Pseudodesulfovibrio sediminis]
MPNILFIRLILFLLSALFFVGIPSGAHAKQFSHLTVIQDNAYRPYSYLDENNEPQGYLIDFWDHFGKVNGVEISFKLGTWQQGLDKIQNGEGDIHGGLFYSEERDAFLDFGNAICSLSTILYISNTATMEEAATCPVGVVKGGYTEYFMRTTRPTRTAYTYPSLDQTVQAAANGELLAFLADQPTAFYAMSRYGIQDTFTAGERLYTKSLQVAVKNGNKELLDFITQGWRKMDRQHLNYIHKKWFMDAETGPDWLLTTTLIGAILVFFGIAISLFHHHSDYFNRN